MPLMFTIAPLVGAAAISAAGSLASSFFGNKKNSDLQRQSQQWQTSEREASQKYQTGEREASQRYQTGERNQQNLWAEQMYKNYASPKAMAEQYMAAGLNPRLAVDGGSVGSPTSGSGTVGGAPGASAPGTPGAVTPPYVSPNNLASGFVDIANSLKAIADAKKSGVETTEMETLLNERLRSLKLENDGKEFYKDVIQPDMHKEAVKRIEQIAQMIETGKVSRDVLKEQLDGLKKDNLIKGYVADHWYETYKQDTDLKNADIGLKKSLAHEADTGADLNVAKVGESHQNVNESKSREALNKLDYDHRDKLFSYAKSRAFYDSLKSAIEVGQSRQEFINSVLKNSNLSMYGLEEIPSSYITSLLDSAYDQFKSGAESRHKDYDSYVRSMDKLIQEMIDDEFDHPRSK